MSKIMSTAEIYFWDFVIPVDKKVKNHQEKKENAFFDQKNSPLTQTNSKPKIQSSNVVVLHDKPQIFLDQKSNRYEEKNYTEKKRIPNHGYFGQIFMILTSSSLGLIIGLLLSVFL